MVDENLIISKEREAKEKAEAKQKEKVRRKTGKEIAEAQRLYKEKEMKKYYFVFLCRC